MVYVGARTEGEIEWLTFHNTVRVWLGARQTPCMADILRCRLMSVFARLINELQT